MAVPADHDDDDAKATWSYRRDLNRTRVHSGNINFRYSRPYNFTPDQPTPDQPSTTQYTLHFVILQWSTFLTSRSVRDERLSRTINISTDLGIDSAKPFPLGVRTKIHTDYPAAQLHQQSVNSHWLSQWPGSIFDPPQNDVAKNFCKGDYVLDQYLNTKFGADTFTGGLWQIDEI